MTTSALPSRRDEAWRYSDIEAVTAAWPLPAPESIIVPAGGQFARAIVQDAGDIRQIELVLGKGAVASLHVLNIGGAYGRFELAVTLHEGADFTLGAAQIGGGEQNLEIVTTITHAEPGATSRQIIRSVLGGTATGTYLGKVAVARDAQQTDSGLDIDALRIVGDGINAIMRRPDKAVLLITHYQRLLDYVRPDFVHVLAAGRIVKSGGPELARELEEHGYAEIAA